WNVGWAGIIGGRTNVAEASNPHFLAGTAAEPAFLEWRPFSDYCSGITLPRRTRLACEACLAAPRLVALGEMSNDYWTHLTNAWRRGIRKRRESSSLPASGPSILPLARRASNHLA